MWFAFEKSKKGFPVCLENINNITKEQKRVCIYFLFYNKWISMFYFHEKRNKRCTHTLIFPSIGCIRLWLNIHLISFAKKRKIHKISRRSCQKKSSQKLYRIRRSKMDQKSRSWTSLQFWFFKIVEIKTRSISISPSNQNLLAEPKAVVFQKDDLEYRDVSILRALLIFGQSWFQFRCTEPISWFLELNSLPELSRYH